MSVHLIDQRRACMAHRSRHVERFLAAGATEARESVPQDAAAGGGMKELRREFCTPDQLIKLAMGEIAHTESGLRPLAESFKRSELWLLEMMMLWGAVAKLQGHDPDPSDALAMVTKNTDFLKKRSGQP